MTSRASCTRMGERSEGSERDEPKMKRSEIGGDIRRRRTAKRPARVLAENGEA